jgi:hypothetical protein
MKTTLEIPDPLLRRAKSVAAERGISLSSLVTETLAERLGTPGGEDKPWMKSFGRLRSSHKETVRIAEEFGKMEPA